MVPYYGAGEVGVEGVWLVHRRLRAVIDDAIHALFAGEAKRNFASLRRLIRFISANCTAIMLVFAEINAHNIRI